MSSTGALSLREVPKRLVVIGAGVIGLELVQKQSIYIYTKKVDKQGFCVTDAFLGFSLVKVRCRSNSCRVS